MYLGLECLYRVPAYFRNVVLSYIRLSYEDLRWNSYPGNDYNMSYTGAVGHGHAELLVHVNET